MNRGSYGRNPWKGILQMYPTFKRGLAMMVGDGRQTTFWGDVWNREHSLKQDFPDLFNLVVDPEVRVADSYSIHGGEVVWALVFRRALFNWEILRMIQLLARLQESHIDPNQDDYRMWKAASGGVLFCDILLLSGGKSHELYGSMDGHMV